MGTTVAGDDAYTTPTLAWLLHSLPHLNVTLHRVNSTFDPRSPVYLESLGILGSIPAAWLILTLFILLIYLLTRCCDHKTRTAKSISALKVTLAVVSVLCCAAVGLGLYGNDDLHNGFTELLAEGRQVNQLVARIRNQTEAIDRQFLIHAKSQLVELSDVFDEPTHNQTALKILAFYHRMAEQNNTQAMNAAADIRSPLEGINLEPKILIGEKIEAIRWPFTMAVLSVLLVLCVVLLVGVARHSRCALIAFSVCGLLAVIASYLMASIYVASSVALGDLCTAPDRFLEEEASPGLPREILHYYTSCERARANPFTQRLREAKAAVEGMRAALNYMRKPTIELFPRRMLEPIFSSLLNQVNEADSVITSLTTLVDCRALNSHYLMGARALCNVGLWGLSLMLMSAMLAGLLMTVLVWVDSHTWIYIRKKKDYQHVMEGSDPYLPPPAASQAIAARTLQRSQGDGCDKRTPDCRGGGVGGGLGVGIGTGAHLSHLRGHTLGRLPSHHHEPLSGPNNGKYATLSKQCKTLESSDFY
ncbi:protein tweety isoform X2 [Agrilus planipennis]|uniref:Protein tweety homolog n=1 Tax=Agrilus planipennis TaxID=224129 RepID=A0A1W4XQZ8_AGRPL|nr:protein tweety isoform X2 [Agrilus planipennis]